MAPNRRRPGRLKRRAEFLRVAAAGAGRRCPAWCCRRSPAAITAPARLGFTVTKKVGNAVVRNRTRRRLRAAARLVLPERQVAGVDLVLIGREATRGRPFAGLQEDLRRALDRTGLS